MHFFKLFLMVLYAWPSLSYAENLIHIEVASNQIDISTGFMGRELVVFGTKADQEADVVVIFKGPRVTKIVRHKQQTAGMWFNRESLRFSSVPVYYDYASSRPAWQLASSETLKTHEIGLDTLEFEPFIRNKEDEIIERFQEALIRNKQLQGLFPASPKQIDFINDQFFKIKFYLPPNVPTGSYILEAFYLKDGLILDQVIQDIDVAQIGLGATIYNFAEHFSFVYGLLCVVLALLAGWLSSALRVSR